MKLRKMMLNINGVDRMFMCDPENDKLSDVLRRIGLTGVKVGCGTGVCGSCSIILNGQVIRSCTKKISQVEEYSKITTIEGYRYSAASASVTGCMDELRCCTVWFLCTRLHRFRICSVRAEPGSDP